MLEIRCAKSEEYPLVRNFYHKLIDDMADVAFHPGWKKDVYPSQDLLTNSIKAGELYIGTSDGEILSCMILNHQCNDGYREIKWTVDASDTEILVIHALGVAPAWGGRGLAKEMVDYALDIAKELQIKTVRLDVLSGNLPAIKAYTKMGFQYMGTVQMFYEDTGWTDFQMFEHLIGG